MSQLRRLLADPDFRLHARYSLGGRRGRRIILGVLVGLLAFGLIASYYVQLLESTFTLDETLIATVVMLWFAGLVLAVIACTQLIIRLTDWERTGRLDQIRLIGRPPHAVLGAALLGSLILTIPYLALPIVLYVSSDLPNTNLLQLGLGIVSAVVAVTLLSYAIAPTRSPAITFSVLGLIACTIWILIATRSMAVAAALVPLVPVTAALAFLLACIRLRHAPLRRGGGRGVAPALGGSLPKIGPAEFRRALGHTVGSTPDLMRLLPGVAAGPASLGRVLRTFSGAFELMLLLPVAAVILVIVSDQVVLLVSAPLMSLAPLFLAPLLAHRFVRREMTTGAIDFVRLSARSSVEVVLGWVAGTSLPLWLLSLSTLLPFALAGAVVAVQPSLFGWMLFGLVSAPFVAVGHALLGERSRLVSTGILAVAMLGEMLSRLHGSVARDEPIGLVARADGSYVGFLALIAVVWPLAAPGMVDGADGPALSGRPALLAVFAATAALLTLPRYDYSTVVPAALAVLGPLLVGDRPAHERGPTIRDRVVLATAAALLPTGHALATGQGAVAALLYGLASALGLAIGIAVARPGAGKRHLTFVLGLALVIVVAVRPSSDLLEVAVLAAALAVMGLHRRRIT